MGKTKLKYNALVYSPVSSKLYFQKYFDNYREARAAIEENILKYADKEMLVGHINKDFLLDNEDLTE